jgi:hypothetical protein
MSTETIGSAAADADAAPLDLLLTDAALGVLNGSTRAAPGCGWRRRWPPGPGWSPPGRGICSGS